MEARIQGHERLRSYCIPLYLPRNEDAFRDGLNVGGVEFLGTGTLLEVGGRRFIVSAQHVVEDADNPHLVYPIGEDQMTNLVGHRVRFNRAVVPPLYDIGILEIGDIPPLEIYQFAALEQTTAYQEPTPEGLIHVACGYPGTRQRAYGHENNVRAQCYSFEWASAEHTAYVPLNLDPQHHIALDFDGQMRLPNGQVATAPQVQGMSGGPIWNTRAEDRIVGVVTHRWRREQLVSGTRIEFALLQIADAFPQLRAEILAWLGIEDLPHG